MEVVLHISAVGFLLIMFLLYLALMVSICIIQWKQGAVDAEYEEMEQEV